MRLGFLILASLFAIGVIANHLTAQTHYRVTSTEHRDPHLKAHACARDGLSPEECKKNEGDHIWPLAAGGPDVLDNMQLQPCDLWVLRNGVPECRAGEAYRKDLVEWQWIGEIRAAERKGDQTKADALRKEAGEYFTTHKRCPPATEGCW